MRSCPVDTRGAALTVAAVGEFAGVDDDAGVEEGAADGPEEGGEAAGLLGCQSDLRGTWGGMMGVEGHTGSKS